MTTVNLAPIKVTVKPIGTVQVKVAPVTRRVTVNPTIRPITIQTLVHQIKVSPVGLQGIPGAPGGSQTYAAIAGEVLGGDRVVRIGPDGKAYYADHTDPTHGRAPLYWTLTSSVLGGQVTMRSLGPVDTPGYGWTPGARIWLSESGLTDYAPDISASFRRSVGVAETPDRIYFNPGIAIYN